MLKAAGVSQAVMAGQVKHVKIFSGIVPDLTLLSVLTRLKARNTDALISAVADVMRDQGIELLDSTAFLSPLLARDGRADDRDRSRRRGAEDLAFGYAMADGMAAMDIGQTIAVKAQGGRRGRGDGRHRRNHRARRRARRPGRAHHQGGEAESGHALRRAGRSASRRSRRCGGPARRRCRSTPGGR